MKLISEAAAQIPSPPEHLINVEETKETPSIQLNEQYNNRLAELKREFLPAGIYVYTCSHCSEVGQMLHARACVLCERSNHFFDESIPDVDED